MNHAAKQPVFVCMQSGNAGYICKSAQLKRRVRLLEMRDRTYAYDLNIYRQRG